jgi:hypothetical protein
MTATRIAEFDTWRAGYGLDTVAIYLAGTTTLASVFTDEALSVSAANPQTLIERTLNGVSYGKFSAPLYIGVAYELLIDSVDSTGVVRPPLVSLDSEDASAATVQVTGGSEDITLADHLARRIDVRDFGEWKAVGTPGASGSTNNATLGDAVGAAAGVGGGFVETPAGTYAFTDVSLPAGVILRGAGEDATILQSETADAVVTIVGTRAGLADLTLDGVLLNANSIGVYVEDTDEVVLDHVTIMRFETGMQQKGGARCAWHGLSFSNCTTGYKGQGTTTSDDELRFIHWRGGTVELCSTTGVTIENAGRAAEDIVISDVDFDTNTGTAAKIVGARSVSLRDCRWKANTADLDVDDATPTTTLNTVKNLEISGGDINGGTIALKNTLDSVIFRRVALASTTITLTSPAHNVHVEDCRENSVTFAGDTTAWRRISRANQNASIVTTTDAVLTKAWAITLEPGEFVTLEIKPIGRQINGGGYYFLHQEWSALRQGSTLAYQTQTGNFTLGNTLTGGTSGATARIVADVDAGATGTLTLYDVVGTFQNGEVITDGSGGSAAVNGTITDGRCKIVTDSIQGYDAQTANFTAGATITGGTSGAKGVIISDTDAGATGSLVINFLDGLLVDNEIITDGLGGSATTNLISQSSTYTALRNQSNEQSSTDYTVALAANGTQLELRVQGKAGHTIEWTIEVHVTSNYRTLV